MTRDTLPPSAQYNDARAVMARRPGTCADCLPLVMWQDFLDEAAGLPMNYHHDFYSLYVIVSGKGTHVIDGEAYGVAKGDVYVMGPGMTHRFTGGERLRADTFHFTLAVFDDATQAALRNTPGFRALLVAETQTPPIPSGDRRWLHLTPSAHHEIAHSIRELKAEWASGTVLGAALTRGLFLRLLVALSRYAAHGAKRETVTPLPRYAGNDPAVAQAVRYMDDHFTGPLRIETVAAQVFLSPDRLTRIFSEIMGRTPRDYLRHVRVERAKTLLATTNAPLAEVARLSGLGQPAYLVRVLRAEIGQTPRAFRLASKRSK